MKEIAVKVLFVCRVKCSPGTHICLYWYLTFSLEINMKITYEMSQKYKGLQLHDPEHPEENSFYSEHAIFTKNL